MDAFAINKCSFEVLRIISTIADKFNARLEIKALPYSEGGLIEWLKIVKKNEDKGAPITTEVIKYLVIGIFAIPAYIGTKIIDRIMDDDNLSDNQKTEYCQCIEDNNVDFDSIENKVVKLRSNFYSAVEKDSNVNRIDFASYNHNSECTNSSSVSRASFPAFILSDNTLEPIDAEDAIIYITAPIIAKGSYQYWHGKYNGEDIKFKMASNEFKTMVQQGLVSFKNGFSINCLLRIHKALTENGDERIIKYEVIRVNNYFIDDRITETNEGRNHRIKKELDNAPNLFTGYEDI